MKQLKFRNNRQGEIMEFLIKADFDGCRTFSLRTDDDEDVNFEKGEIGNVFQALEHMSESVSGTITATR